MKDFLLICDKNCATYKEVFPLFKQGIVSFGSPVKEYDGTDRKFGNHSWITTFPVSNKKKLILTATYDPALYPKYDNYDAIEVSRIKNIPYDYDGVMGVPITILDYDLDNVEINGLLGNFKETDCNETTGFKCGDDVSAYNLPGTQNGPVIITTKGPEAKYKRVLIKKNFEINPEQFEILGMCENLDLYKLKTKVYTTEECKDAYYAKFGKEGVYDLNASGVMIRNGKLEKVYQRIFIRRKK